MTRFSSRGRLCAALSVTAVVAVVLTPCSIVLSRNLGSGLEADISVYDDPAIAELYTLRASQGDQHLGPYSRLRLHHPGPAMFYALAPFYTLGDRSHGSLCLGAVVLNMGWALAIVVTAAVLFGAGGVVWSAISVVVMLTFMSPYYWASIWNPNVGLLPMALALVACAGLALRAWPTLPVLVGAASFAAQTHVVYGVFLSAMVLSAIAAALVSRTWDSRASGDTNRRVTATSVGIAAMVGAVLWLPVAVSPDAVGIENLVELLRITFGRSGEWDLSGAFGRCSYWLSAAYLAPFGLTAREGVRQAVVPITMFVTVFQLLLFVAIAAHGFTKRRAKPFALGFLGVSSFLCSFALAAHPEAASFPHLVRWTFLCGPVFIAMVVSSMFREVGGRRPLLVRGGVALGWSLLMVLGLIAVGASLDWMSVRDFIRLGWGQASYAPAWEAVEPALSHDCSEGSHIRILDDGLWPYAAGVFLQLEKTGRAVSVDGRWRFMFGRDDGSNGPAPDCLTVLSASGRLAHRTDGNLVASLPTKHGPLDIRLYSAGGVRGTVDLRLDDQSFAHLIECGFSGFEGDECHGSRWSSGERSVFDVFLRPGLGYRMEFEAQAFPVPGRHQAATFSVNGISIGETEVSSSWEDYSLSVPPSAVRDLNRVTIAYRYAESPKALGRSNDSRQLAVRFRGFRFSES